MYKSSLFNVPAVCLFVVVCEIYYSFLSPKVDPELLAWEGEYIKTMQNIVVASGLEVFFQSQRRYVMNHLMSVVPHQEYHSSLPSHCICILE